MDPLAILAIIGLGLAALALFNGIVSMARSTAAQAGMLQGISYWRWMTKPASDQRLSHLKNTMGLPLS